MIRVPADAPNRRAGPHSKLDEEAAPAFGVRIKQLQLEQDAARTSQETRRLMVGDTWGNESFKTVDFNRAGVALMEIVTLPDMR